MSYNFDAARTLSCSLTMTREAVQKWAPRWRELAEGVAGDVGGFEKEVEGGGEGPFEFDAFRWFGEGSGRAYEEVLEEFVADLQGEADVVLVRDDEMTGLKIVDGEAVEHAVELTLGKRVARKERG